MRQPGAWAGALLAVRREAITWQRAYQGDSPEAYWSYLKRYPRGPHTGDSRRLLTHLGAAIEPPPKFAMTEFDVPSPLPYEMEYVERAVLLFDDPKFAFAPPPPSPNFPCSKERRLPVHSSAAVWESP